MFDRKKYKIEGEAKMRRNYWPSVFAGLIAILPAFIIGLMSSISGFSVHPEIKTTLPALAENFSSTFEFSSEIPPELSMYVGSPHPSTGALAAAGLIIYFLVVLSCFIMTAFITNPIDLGVRNFFYKNSLGNASIKDLGYGFNPNYIHKVNVMFGAFFRVFLWSLLFIIPGIVKYYEYAAVPYLIAENDLLTTSEALEQSRKIMRGNKWNAFVMDLSFIGWELLSIFTCGLLDVVFVTPYRLAAHAEMINALKANIDAE